jgi:rubrerythrin
MVVRKYWPGQALLEENQADFTSWVTWQWFLCHSFRELSSVKVPMPKRFKDLTQREILALAITSEEEDGRIYGEFADALRESYPATAEMFEEMRTDEAGHRDRLLALFHERFGDHIPPIRREKEKRSQSATNCR